jgi:hypothetical protein
MSSSSTVSEDQKVADYEEKGGHQLDADVTSADDRSRKVPKPLAFLWKVAKKLDSYGVEVSCLSSHFFLERLFQSAQRANLSILFFITTRRFEELNVYLPMNDTTLPFTMQDTSGDPPT